MIFIIFLFLSKSCLVICPEGAKLVLTDIDEEKGNKRVAKINTEGGESVFNKANAASPEDPEKGVDLPWKDSEGFILKSITPFCR